MSFTASTAACMIDAQSSGQRRVEMEVGWGIAPRGAPGPWAICLRDLRMKNPFLVDLLMLPLGLFLIFHLRKTYDTAFGHHFKTHPSQCYLLPVDISSHRKLQSRLSASNLFRARLPIRLLFCDGSIRLGI